MSEKKKKINTAHYNELSRFVIDMPFEESVQTLDDSEKDMPQLRSDIVADDEDEKLMRLTYAEASALLILIKSWARGSMTQVTVFRGATRQRSVFVEKPPAGCWLSLLIMMWFSLFLAVFLSNGWSFLWLSIGALMVILLIAFLKEDRAYNSTKIAYNEAEPIISHKPITPNKIYENLLLNYVSSKLKVESEQDGYNESIENQQLKGRRS